MKLLTISQKRTCKGCRSSLHGYCDLGYKTKGFVSKAPEYNLMEPLGPCPKPKTISDHVYCLQNKWTQGEYKMKKRNFTLIELLVVIAIIGILLGILLPAIAGSMQESKKTKARSTARQIALACEAYVSEYGVNVIATDAEVDFNASARDHLNGNNWRSKTFFKADSPIKNPWGGIYTIIVDAEYDNSIDTSLQANPIGGRVLVWTYTNKGELLKSWED